MPSSKKGALALQPYKPGSEHNLWYCKTVHLSSVRAYMQRLLAADELFEQGVLCIHHGQAVAYYYKVLGGRSTGEIEREVNPPTEMEHDAEDMAAGPA